MEFALFHLENYNFFVALFKPDIIWTSFSFVDIVADYRRYSEGSNVHYLLVLFSRETAALAKIAMLLKWKQDLWLGGVFRLINAIPPIRQLFSIKARHGLATLIAAQTKAIHDVLCRHKCTVSVINSIDVIYRRNETWQLSHKKIWCKQTTVGNVTAMSIIISVYQTPAVAGL